MTQFEVGMVFNRDKATEIARRRYDRNALFYDWMEAPMERGGFSPWRHKLWSLVEGPDVLEVGVGTGKNFPYYPKDVRVTAIDFSPRMLDRARRKAEEAGIKVDLGEMDAQHLEFADGSFDTVLTTFVFCSVPDPVLGLKEIRRVTKPTGKVILLEHVRPLGMLGNVADAINPLVVRMMGANINRRTEDNIERSGLRIERVESLWRDIVKLIVARPQ